MATFLRLEQCLLPPPETIRWNRGDWTLERCTTVQKIVHCVKNIVLFWGLLFIAPLTLAHDWWTNRAVALLKPPVGEKTPQWPPAEHGFACSLFQTSGLGTKWSASPKLEGKCDWDQWMDNPSHILHGEGFDYQNFFTDVLTDPAPYIAMLKEHKVTAHRFSLEWSVIEPALGRIDETAVNLYRIFIQKLIVAGIEPHITLSHFVVPQWFYEQGNFQNVDNIDRFVRFGLKAMELFPEVKQWWSFNELGVKAFQQAREVYPTDLPEGSSLSQRVYAAGIATRNMLIAHCKLHQQVATLHSDKKIGVTHQWLKFDTASGNWLERVVRYYFEKFGFYPVYRFFKDGRYAFEFPFMANIQFEIPQGEFEDNRHYLMQLGVQAYPKPLIKMGLNDRSKPPCAPGTFQNSWVTFGASCGPGEAVMRIGPRWKEEAIDEILDEAFALTDQVYITEYGSDARVYQWGKGGFEFDDEAQLHYLQRLTERIRDYTTSRFKEIKGIFCWSDLRRQLEWENGHECRVALIDPIVDADRKMVGWKSSPASQYFGCAFAPS